MTANITGALGIIVNMLIYQQNNRERLLICKLISDVLWAMHYFSLDAYSGAAIAVIGVFRELVFYSQAKKHTKNNFWLALFLLISIMSAVFTWKSCFSILPAAASAISVISFWNNRPGVTRYLAFIISFLMLTYDIFCHSYMGIVSEVFILLSALIGTLRYLCRSKSV